jgi:acetyl-CoA carboxylase/biotin carboxylase 1
LRLSIDSRTILVAQENDPTQLRSPSPGKLVRYFIESGEHLSKGQAYAEIEVMKVSASTSFDHRQGGTLLILCGLK